MNAMVVLNYNDFDTTYDYVMKIQNYDSVDQIIVVDNQSPDGSYERLKKLSNSKVAVIQTEKNDGYASGNNYGSKYAIEKYQPDTVIISNPDIIVEDSTISKMTELIKREPSVGAATGLIYNLKEEVVDNFAWKLPTYWDMLFSNFMSLNYIRREIFHKGIEYSIQPGQEILQADVLHGCFFAVDAAVLEKVNYFDERTFLYGEENLFFSKLNELGLSPVVLLKEKVVHMEGVSINKEIKNWKKKFSFYEESRLLYLKDSLNVSALKLWAFKFSFKLGKYEKFMINRLRSS